MRPLIGACAACIASICVHPIDTIYIHKQLKSNQKVFKPMAGCLHSASSAFITTGLYFSMYEYTLMKINILVCQHI